MSEHESQPTFEISEMTVDDIDPATQMRYQSWKDTYQNDALGITLEWINKRFETQLSDEYRGKRIERFTLGKQNSTFNAWVAKDTNGEVIGSTTPYIDEEGIQHVGSLYVDKKWHGTGVGSQLMQKVINWLDPAKPIELGVITYNERARAFYRKWEFEDVPGSETLYDNIMPEIKMIRPATNQPKEQA
ncbi:MAG: GNAT family N-acetyltransferase [Candidatus Microsaccharimonas sp.]